LPVHGVIVAMEAVPAIRGMLEATLLGGVAVTTK